MSIATCALLTSQAWGWPPVAQTFIIRHKPDFDDVGAAVGDDYVATNAARPAAFARVGLFKNGVLQGFEWTDDVGEVTFTDIDPDDSYVVRLLGLHDINRSFHSFRILDDLGGDILFAETDPFNPPIVSTTTTITFDAAEPGQEWINLAVVGSWMIRRRPAAWLSYPNDAVYTMIFQPPPGNPTGAGVYQPSDVATYVNPNSRSGYASKFLIAHEFAHQLQHWVPYAANPFFDVTSVPTQVDYSAADDSNCPWISGQRHYMVSKEYQSAAITEGMADWITAVAFNNTNQDDCRLKPYGDFPWLDSAIPLDNEFSCQGWDDVNNEGDNGGIEWTYYGIDAFDYLGDYCNAGVMTDRGTELDWMRFFWDLDRTSTGGEGMGFLTIMDYWAAAEPFQWESVGSGARQELEAAFSVNHSTQWNNQDNKNGIHR